MQRRCCKCHVPLKNGGMCPTHYKEYFKAKSLAIRLEIEDYKVHHGCKDCGYNKHHAGLEFDHVRGAKRCTVAALVSRGNVKGLWKEIAKCEVVCSTCHSIRTWTRRQKAALV